MNGAILSMRSRSATRKKYTSQDLPIAMRMSSIPCFLSSRYSWLLPGMVNTPGQNSCWVGVMTPYTCAANAYSGLTVEPGG